MTHEEVFACEPRTGLALWWLRLRHLVLGLADRADHRLHGDTHRDGEQRFCFDLDSAYAERLFNDQRFHDHVAAHMTPAKVTGPPPGKGAAA